MVEPPKAAEEITDRVLVRDIDSRRYDVARNAVGSVLHRVLTPGSNDHHGAVVRCRAGSSEPHPACASDDGHSLTTQ
jgi:hypothetical protein